MINIEQLLPGDVFQGLMNSLSPSAANPFLTKSAADAEYVPLVREITINGVTYDLSADRSWTVTAGFLTQSVTFTFDGQGGVISTGSVSTNNGMPYNGTITGWEVLETSDVPVASDIVIDVWKDTYANYPPTVADTIFVTKPSLTAAIKNSATGLTIPFLQGDILKAHVDSVTGAIKVQLRLFITVSP